MSRYFRCYIFETLNFSIMLLLGTMLLINVSSALLVIIFEKIPFGKHPGQYLDKGDLKTSIPFMFGLIVIAGIVFFMFRLISFMKTVKASVLQIAVIDEIFETKEFIRYFCTTKLQGNELKIRFSYKKSSIKYFYHVGEKIDVLLYPKSRKAIFPLGLFFEKSTY
jgi:hypothetical protein